MTKNRFKNLLKILVLVFLISNLTACNLASKDSEKVESKDKMIGVFVTEEAINFEAFNNSEEIEINDLSELDKFRRLYVTKSLDKDYDNEYPKYNYDFKGIKGAYMFIAKEAHLDEHGEKVFCDYCEQDGIADAYFQVKDKDSIDLKGTLYLNINSDYHNFCINGNPMYQDSEGNIYISSGNAMVFSSEHYSDGYSSGSISRNEKYEVNNMGEKTTSSQDIKVDFVFKNPCQSFKILEMDDNNQIIKTNEFEITKTPEIFKVSEDTTYLIIEESSLNHDNEIEVKRALLNKKDEDFKLYTADKEDSFCEELIVYLEWE